MRFAATVLLWLLTTVALAVAVPMGWTQLNLVSVDGYATLAEKAASDPGLQAAVASELTTKAMTLIHQRGYTVSSAQVHAVAAVYTTSPSFPPHFADANRALHGWLFARPGPHSDQWVVDVAPMLDDPVFDKLLVGHHVSVPATVAVPVTVSPPKTLHPGKLRPMAVWGPWVSIAAAALAGICALLTFAVARNRGRALAALGVSALLAGAAGWAGMEIARQRINNALNQTPGDIRRIAEAMLGHAEAALHQWLNLTLAAGGVLVGLGIIVAVLGSLWKPG